ncbi:MAG: amidophosphoribosyltransferase [Desulfobacterales bacterium]
MCGIAGIAGGSHVALDLYEVLSILQHRGQDAAGMAICNAGKMVLQKANGLVRDVFKVADLERIIGTMGIGHVRYPTSGCYTFHEAQPFYVNSPYGIMLAHNGNLTNTTQLKKELFQIDRRHINTDSDSEILLNVFAHELHKNSRPQLTAEGVFKSVRSVHRRCRGGYAVVAMINGHGLVAFRDPNGIRPAVLGERRSSIGSEYMIASESCALDVLGFTLISDIDAGEAVYIDMHNRLQRRQCSDRSRLMPCIFEYVYLARPDSIIDGTSVYQARLRMGRKLAAKINRQWPRHDIDVVIPVPDTSRTAALELANCLGITYREGFIKNRYINRTFIMSNQRERETSVRRKLNPIAQEFKNKKVLLVDDSIVRGTTSKQIIQLARAAGAKKVYFASAAPPVRFPNVYGIDMPSRRELIAHGRSRQEVAGMIGADRLIYQDLEDLIACVSDGNTRLKDFECSIFDGVYIAGRIEPPNPECPVEDRNPSTVDVVTYE